MRVDAVRTLTSAGCGGTDGTRRGAHASHLRLGPSLPSHHMWVGSYAPRGLLWAFTCCRAQLVHWGMLDRVWER